MSWFVIYNPKIRIFVQLAMSENDNLREINLTVGRYFKAQGISHREVAERLGYKNVSIVNNQLSYGRFGKRVAARWAKEFGFNEEFLMSGKGNLIERQSSYQKLVRENESLRTLVRILKRQLSERANTA